MSELLDRLLSSQCENELLEFKRAKNSYESHKLGQYFSALSNEANLKSCEAAYLIMGVNNNRTIVGTNINEDKVNQFKKEIYEHTSPALGFNDVIFEQTEQGSVIIFEIPAAPKGIAVSWKGHRYGRHGESIGGLTDIELDKIHSQRRKVDWSQEIIPGATINDLDDGAVSYARQQYAEKNPHLSSDIDGWDNETFLNKAKITIAGKVTRTAILLLGKAVSEHYINPARSTITWVLQDKDNTEKDYAHFSCPLLLSVNQVFKKIRNLRFRYMQGGTLFPDEVDQYDPFIVREALNNCIAHQDYSLGGKIIVVEREDGILTFVNSGSFIPGSVEKVLESDAPENVYRSPHLANAMVSLNMIDTIGSGIRKMFIIQKNKFFPLPDYDLSSDKVKVQIYGKIIDQNYARKLAEIRDLSLAEIILLDKVAKLKPITVAEAKQLKQKKLIEGRRPRFHISSSVANKTGDKAAYLKRRGIDDSYCRKMIVDYLENFGSAKKADLEKILLDKLPDILDIYQKKNKIKNNLQNLKNKGVIEVNGKVWKMSSQS